MSSIPHGDKAASPCAICPCECLQQVLPGAFVAMAAPECTQNAKNKLQVKLSSCLEKSFLLSLYFHPIGSRLICSEKLDLIQMPRSEPADGLGVERSFLG